jgi:hypothetical protein
MFAFLGVRQGVQALRVIVKGKVFPAQIFPTEDRHVSYLDLELRDKVVSQFKVVDAFNLKEQLDARVRMVGTDEVLSFRGQSFVQYASSGIPLMAEAEVGPEFEISRISLSNRTQTVYVPMIRREWLNTIYKEMGIFSLPGRGIVVGFIDDQDFEAEMTGFSSRETPQIVYFDAQGKVVTSRTGVAGGGFIIFNAPPGLQTVYVHPAQSRAGTFSQVVVAEPEFVQVITHSIGKAK